jgi:hypothetical protein
MRTSWPPTIFTSSGVPGPRIVAAAGCTASAPSCMCRRSCPRGRSTSLTRIRG